MDRAGSPPRRSVGETRLHSHLDSRPLALHADLPRALLAVQLFGLSYRNPADAMRGTTCPAGSTLSFPPPGACLSFSSRPAPESERRSQSSPTFEVNELFPKDVSLPQRRPRGIGQRHSLGEESSAASVVTHRSLCFSRSARTLVGRRMGQPRERKA